MSFLDICSSNYEFRSSIRTADVKKFASKIRDDLPLEETISDELIILDIGSGLGDSVFALRENFPNSKIIGIDVNTSALNKAKVRVDDNMLEGIELFTLDISDLQFEEKFQQITGYSTGVIHLAWSAYLVSQLTTSDRQIAIRNIQKILAPKGRVYLLDFIWSETDKIMMELNCSSEYRSSISIPEFVQDPRLFKMPRDREFSKNWLQTLDSLNFEVLQIVSNKLHYQITSLSNFVQVLENICPTLNFISDEQKRVKYFLEFFKRTFDQLMLPKLKNVIVYYNLLICARKKNNQSSLESQELNFDDNLSL